MNREQLIKDGYVTFNLKDFDIELYDRLKKTIPTDTSFLSDRIYNFFFCGELKIPVLDFIKELEHNFPNLVDDFEYKLRKEEAINFGKNENASPNFLTMGITADGMESAKQIKDFIFEKYLDRQTQSWINSSLEWDNEVEITNIKSKIINYFYNDKDDWAHLCFPPIKESNVSVTCFPKDCLILNHSDGSNENRLAAILIYLNENWDIQNGGNLVVRKGTKEETIPAEYGQVAILDFTENNIEHEVTEVIGDRNRWAVLSFLER